MEEKVSFNTFQIHYWFSDSGHTMDAFIQNKCESEILKIVKEISNFLDIEIELLTEPLSEGGLRRTFKIIEKKAKKYPFFTLLLVGVIGYPTKEVITHTIDKLYEDKEWIALQKENLLKQNRNLDLEYNEKVSDLLQKNTIRKKVSNFYEALDSYGRIEKVSYLAEKNNKNITEEVFVYKNQFNEFILPSNDLEPENIEDEIIEIVSPVLKKDDYKWRGIYNGNVVSFSMKSQEFKSLIQQGKIEFKNGSSIKCDITIEKFLDAEGNERIKNINVLAVNEFLEIDKPLETPEGKKKRQKKEGEKQQYKLFKDL